MTSSPLVLSETSRLYRNASVEGLNILHGFSLNFLAPKYLFSDNKKIYSEGVIFAWMLELPDSNPRNAPNLCYATVYRIAKGCSTKGKNYKLNALTTQKLSLQGIKGNLGFMYEKVFVGAFTKVLYIRVTLRPNQLKLS